VGKKKEELIWVIVNSKATVGIGPFETKAAARQFQKDYQFYLDGNPIAVIDVTVVESFEKRKKRRAK
jgi:hypothetical protein